MSSEIGSNQRECWVCLLLCRTPSWPSSWVTAIRQTPEKHTDLPDSVVCVCHWHIVRYIASHAAEQVVVVGTRC